MSENKILDKNGILYLWNKIKLLVSNKVDKIEGKSLSTNDYTNEDKTKLASFQAASNYALKTDLTSLYRYKGSVADIERLPAAADNVTGDVYNVQTDGHNYAWTGAAWDDLGGTFRFSALTNDEIDEVTPLVIT